MEKPLYKSMTVWGAAIYAIGKILTMIGEPLSQGNAIPWATAMPEIIALLGFIAAVAGGRRAFGK